MNQERILKVLVEPHISEKSSAMGASYHQYTFKVAVDASKIEIKQAIENSFNVKVKSVRTCKKKSKMARFGKVIGRQGAWKKAYVSLQAGQEINIAGVSA